MLPIPQRAMALVLAGGCAWWAALALLRTRAMADLIGASEAEVRPAIGARVQFDLSDALAYARGRPAVAAMTLGFAALGAAALASRSR